MLDCDFSPVHELVYWDAELFAGPVDVGSVADAVLAIVVVGSEVATVATAGRDGTAGFEVADEGVEVVERPCLFAAGVFVELSCAEWLDHGAVSVVE